METAQTLTLNTTTAYHTEGLDTLGWELTVCNTLEPPGSPSRGILERDDSYGGLLFEHLSRLIPMDRVMKILEIGGGYGYLMRDFIRRNGRLQAILLDISPRLLERQRETLRGHNAEFIRQDFLETHPSVLAGVDLAILNENLGDFPTLLNMTHRLVQAPPADLPDIARVALAYFERYGLAVPATDPFHVNIGALEAVEKLCTARIPYIFIGEHSCEATVPEAYRSLIRILPTGNPERIALKGHDEYTVRFSHLEAIARDLGYRTLRGPFADFIPVAFTGRLQWIMAFPAFDDAEEIIRHFIEDLYQYEYLVLSRTTPRMEGK